MHNICIEKEKYRKKVACAEAPASLFSLDASLCARRTVPRRPCWSAGATDIFEPLHTYMFENVRMFTVFFFQLSV